MKSNNVIVDKSKAFAIRIVKLANYLINKKEFVISDQIKRSGTSIGANVKEAICGQSRADFYSKINIALKEASETEYWIEILHETGYISEAAFVSIYTDCKELIKILTAISKTQKNSNV